MLTLNYVRSLFLASVLSFLVPIAFIGVTIVFLLLLGFVPGLMAIGQICSAQLLAFLQIFGNGNALEGTIVIGFACALVGALFDTYIFTVTTSLKPLSK
ncbi:hypothetical protein IQ250_18380 [Pseudanabaenaceae cyanobacterium LEGE 13415]|nr:hypothetical protein [Pseudanabaenaceae cyanobacterium LEGE 13415]